MDILISSLEQSLLLLPLVIGIYLSYQILKVTDLTVDGTYVLGAAVFARSLELGLSLVAGAMMGLIVACMQRHNRVDALVVGILCTFMLYSVNLQVLGRPNISLLDQQNLTYFFFQEENWILLLGALNSLLLVILLFFLKSPAGLYLRAFGFNQKLLSVLGKSAENYRILGLVLSNLLAALTGALTSQVNGFADINMGFGIALVSIGAIVIGRHLIIRNHDDFSALKELLACAFGIFLYFLCLNGLLKIGINPVNLKFVLGTTLFFTLLNIQKKDLR